VENPNPPPPPAPDAGRHRILIATSNRGKLRDFAGAAAPYGIEVVAVPGFDALPAVAENAPTLEANACLKAEHYSRLVADEFVLADDSGLWVDALQGAPGVHSARYAALGTPAAGAPARNSSDQENNSRLLRELQNVPDLRRTAKFVCALALARKGGLVVCFHGETFGIILHQPRGSGGFGYDPLFFVPSLKQTFAELTPEEKANISHRGQAFRKLLAWCEHHSEVFTDPPFPNSPP
jgi:XTP/dITP diphosphohydrolase